MTQTKMELCDQFDSFWIMNMKYTLAWGWINFKNFDLKIEKLLGESGGDFFRWRGGVMKNNIVGGGLPKKGGLEQFADLTRGGLEQVANWRGLGKKGGVFLRWGWYPNAHNETFITWRKLLSKELCFTNLAMKKQQIRTTLPKCFNKLFPKTRTIIDCSEGPVH